MLSALKVTKAARMACSRSAGKGCTSTMARISAPTRASALTSSVSRVLKWALIRPARSSKARNSRKACAVVANPVGTLTPDGRLEIISPRLAFLPPTESTSVILRFSNGTTRSVGLKSADMGNLQKLKAGHRRRPDFLVMGPCACRQSDFVVVLLGQRGAWKNSVRLSIL